jgi:hypothetical protein
MREANSWHYQLYQIGESVQLHSLAFSFALADVYAHVSTDNDSL